MYSIKDSSPKCDYLVLNDDKRAVYFIELKGTDINHAIEQIEKTSEKLKKYLNNYVINMRIIYSGQVPNSKIIDLRKKHKNLNAKYRKLEEYIIIPTNTSSMFFAACL